MNKSMWESWDESELSDRQREKYEIVDTGGESSYTGRTLFKVTCRVCNDLVHGSTNNPSHNINMHELYGCKE